MLLGSWRIQGWIMHFGAAIAVRPGSTEGMYLVHFFLFHVVSVNKNVNPVRRFLDFFTARVLSRLEKLIS
jgi:hypothetical protein